MTLEQIRQIVEVARTGSINQAAANLYLSQPNLSLSLKNLENELGYQLFARTNRGINMTARGRAFADYAETILLQINQLENLNRPTGRREIQSLSIANMCYRYVNDAASRFFSRHTGEPVHLVIKEGLRDHIVDMVYKGECEIGIVGTYSYYRKTIFRQMNAKQLQYYRLAGNPLTVIIGPRNPYYKEPPARLTAGMLTGLPHIMYDELDYGPYSNLTRMLGLEGCPQQIVVNSRATLYDMIEKTNGFSIATTNRMAYAHTGYYPNIKSLDLAESTVTGDVGWIKRKDHTPSPLALEFLQILSEYYVDFPEQEDRYMENK